MFKAETAGSSAAQCQPEECVASVQKALGPAWQCVLQHFRGAYCPATKASSRAASCQAQLGAVPYVHAWQLTQVDNRERWLAGMA